MDNWKGTLYQEYLVHRRRCSVGNAVSLSYGMFSFYTARTSSWLSLVGLL